MADIRIDTSLLTYTKFVIPGVTPEVVDGAASILLALEPGAYDFQQPGSSARFAFRVTSLGTIDYDTRNDTFLSGRGRTALIVQGHSIILDSAQLSHSILPMVVGAQALAPGRHQLTLVPAAGYGFQPASGIVADFTLTVTADGVVVVDPRFAGFARVDGRTAIITGWRITLDTRTLSHSILPMMLSFTGGHLPPGMHDIAVLPAAGYGLVSAGIADVIFHLAVDGRMVVDPRYAGLAHVSGRTLIVGRGAPMNTTRLIAIPSRRPQRPAQANQFVLRLC
jgi:hypothetical protein